MRIGYAGIYGPRHPRNTTIIQALRLAGHTVDEICIPPTRGVGKYLKLARALRGRSLDALFIGFPGQQAVLAARTVYRGPIIFNALLSLYDSVVTDRREYGRWHPYAWYLFVSDVLAARAADITLLDCEAYVRYYASLAHMPSARFACLYQSADEGLLPALDVPEEPEVIHYYSSFHPSNGTDIIVRAAALLKGEGIRFILSGEGSCRARDERLARELAATNVTFTARLPNADVLNRFIRSSWVSLGLFSNNAKADRAIGTKVVEALWCERPVVAADTAGTRELFTSGENALLVPPEDPEALADALRRLASDEALRRRIAEGGKAVYEAHCSLAVTSKELDALIARQV